MNDTLTVSEGIKTMTTVEAIKALAKFWNDLESECKANNPNATQAQVDELISREFKRQAASGA